MPPRPSAPPSNRPVAARTTCPPASARVDEAPAAPRPALRERLRTAAGAALSVGRVLLAAGALAGSLAGGRLGHRWLVTTPRFAARDVEVTGATHTPRAQILGAARITPTRNVLSIDGEAAARAIERLPWVSHARVVRRLPGQVRIEVEERTAAAVLSSGGLYLVSTDGEVFKRAEMGDPVDLPLLTGIARESIRDDRDVAQERIRDALGLLADLDAAMVGPRVSVEEVHSAETGELSVVLGGAYVWLGRGPYRARLTRLRVVLQELQRRGVEAAEVHLESERHPERVTVLPRRGPATVAQR
jgi:cell division protein FtsQ